MNVSLVLYLVPHIDGRVKCWVVMACQMASLVGSDLGKLQPIGQIRLTGLSDPARQIPLQIIVILLFHDLQDIDCNFC